MLSKKSLKRDLLRFKKINDNLNIKIYKISIPTNFTIIFFKTKTNNFYFLKMFNKTFFINFPLLYTDLTLYFDKDLNILSLSRQNFSNHFNTWLSNVVYILFTMTSFYLHKVKFKGKGYYLYKNLRNTITPQFGYSHRIYFYSYFLRTTFLTKTKVLFFGFNKFDLFNIAYSLRSKRSINIFTGRGVRFARQVIYKKTGKVSSYR